MVWRCCHTITTTMPLLHPILACLTASLVLTLVAGKQCTNGGGNALFQSHTMMSLLSRYDMEVLDSVLQYRPTHAGRSRQAMEVERSLGSSSAFVRKELSLTDGFLQEFQLQKVRLNASFPQGVAQTTNLEYLLMLDVDSLLWNFRATAGLKTVGKPLGGWEHPQCELRGHFVGHYLSATALMWASTGGEAVKQKMEALVTGLAECQDAIGTGYLSAFPTSLFDRFEAIQPVWAPYYTIHKIMAGLLDQYEIAGSDRALSMVSHMADYFKGRVENVVRLYTVERHWASLNEEVGGMNDVLYRLYTVTGDAGHLWLAHLFDKPCFLGPLALNTDWLSGLHSNTHIPIVIGAQQRYEVTGDKLYKEIALNFYSIINSSHMYSTGGTSAWEFWQPPNRLGDTLGQDDEESCCTYNLLKVARNLFRWTREARYGDYIERALTNGVLGIQRGKQPGQMIYLLGLGTGNSKARGYHGWGTPLNAFWCCYGTGVESFSKLGDSIYFQQTAPLPALYVIQFVDSTLQWDAAQLNVTQKVDLPTSLHPILDVTLLFSTLSAEEEGRAGSGNGRNSKGPMEVPVRLRVPWWATTNNNKASLNGKPLRVPDPGEFLEVRHEWKTGDSLRFSLQLTISAEHIQDDRPGFASLHAIMFGPYLLAGMTHDSRSLHALPSSIASDLSPVSADTRSRLVSFGQKPPPAPPVSSGKNCGAAASGGPPSLGRDMDLKSMERGELEAWMDEEGSAGEGQVSADKIAARIESRFGPDPHNGGTWTDMFSFLEPQPRSKDAWVASREKHVLRAVVGQIVVGPTPSCGTDEAAESTFVLSSPLPSRSLVPRQPPPAGAVSLELFARPGQYLAHNGAGRPAGVLHAADLETEAASRATFRIVPGLTKAEGEVSLEATDLPGHFLSTYCGMDVPGSGRIVSLRKQVLTDLAFATASSFSRDLSFASYDPMTFVARGRHSHDFVLSPIQSYVDESYTAYFDLGKNDTEARDAV